MSDPHTVRTAVKDVVDSYEIQHIITFPRIIPHTVREEVAGILAEDLLSGYVIRDHSAFAERYGMFGTVLFLLNTSQRWDSLKRMAARNDLMPVMILRMILPLVFDIMESRSHTDTNAPGAMRSDERADVHMTDEGSKELDAEVGNAISKELNETENELNAELKAMDLLSLLFPGKGFDLSVKEMHREFLGNIERYASLVDKNEDLSRIVEIVGRMESELGLRRTEKTRHGHSEVHSIRFSDDIQRMLPHEILNLTDPEFEMMFYSRFSEKKLMTYDLKGRERVSGPPKDKRKGPVVMLIDTSGSMYGEPELIAKAVSLTIARRMIPEKRDVKVILFSTGTTEISLTSKEKMGREFLDFLSYTFGGGTDFNIALREGMRAMREKEWNGADLLFISDGHSVVNDGIITAEWNLLKEMNDARVFSVIINNDDAAGLEGLSDSVYILDRGTIWEQGGNYVRMFSDLM